MTIESQDNILPEEQNDFDRYYIMYNPSTVNLMDKIGIENFSVQDVVHFLSGKELDSCTERNYTSFLSFDKDLLRKGMFEQLAIESYGSYYVANLICRAEPEARVILSDDTRRTIGQIIGRERKKPAAVFITSMSSSFPAACAATHVLNRVGIPVIIGGIHVSTSKDDMDIYIRDLVPNPELVSAVIGAADTNVMLEILTDLHESNLKKEYRGTIQIEDGIWGNLRVSELPKMRPRFINKFPIAGPILSRRISTNVTTPFLGCPYSCSFCSISSLPPENRKFTSRSPVDFVEELLDKQRDGATFKNRFYFFSSDNLLVGGKKLFELLDGIIESPLSVNYAAQISIEVADDELLLRKLRRSGASHFFIGFESLDIRNLELVGKNIAQRIKKEGTTVEEFYSSRIKKIQDYGISIHGAFIFGMPYDYFNTLSDHTGIKIADFCLKNKIGLQPSCLSHVPGSLDFIESQQKNDLIYGNPGTMDYFCSLSIADMTECNHGIPDSLMNSPLVAYYIMHDAIKRIGSYTNTLRVGFGMARKALKVPTATGALSLKERIADGFAAIGFQLGASTYLELYNNLATSTRKIRGTLERLYDNEKNPDVKKIFTDYVKAYK